MRLSTGSRRALVALAVALLAVAAIAVLALHAWQGLVVADAWAASTGRSIAVYLTLRNNGLQEKCIVGVELAEPIQPGAAVAEIHQTVEENGVYRMRPLERLCIPPLSVYEMRPGPGGTHIMVMGAPGAVEEIVRDGVVSVCLILGDGSRVLVDAPVES